MYNLKCQNKKKKIPSPETTTKWEGDENLSEPKEQALQYGLISIHSIHCKMKYFKGKVI
jgi:hypothetical protein